jgi:hypothetical protein
MSKPSLPRGKHSHAPRYTAKRGMKEREAGRAEKKRLWHSFLYADVTYWTIDSPRSGFWQGAFGALDFETPFRHRVSGSLIESKKHEGEETSRA